ncbi:MAG: CPBP family glutamic-type intramembrane protease [Pseudomonadota bacterium]
MQMSDLSEPASAPRRLRLWAEFATLFVGVPLLLVAYAGSYPLFPVLALLAGVAMALLILTSGFRFAELLAGPVLGEWRLVLIFAVLSAAGCIALVLALHPGRLFSMPLHRPELWVAIMLLYPVFSAAPQELIFRTLFFRRYGTLFPSPAAAVAANGAVFGFGHLFYMNAVAIGLTTLAGAVIGWAYLMRGRSFLLACLLHALAGQIMFTAGLGLYFYHRAWAP